MTLPVPLSLRVGSKHLTREVADVTFRVDAIGGLRSLSFKLFRPLDVLDPTLTVRADCYLTDGRSARPLGSAKIVDTGRTASQDGQTWEIVAFGPAQHATDITRAYILIDQSQERWTRSSTSVKRAETGVDERSDETPTLIVKATEGKHVEIDWEGGFEYRALFESGQRLGRVSAQIDAGLDDANYVFGITTREGAGITTVAVTDTAGTTADSIAAEMVTDFPNGRNIPGLRVVRNTDPLPDRTTAVTLDAATNEVRATAHGYDNGEEVVLFDKSGGDGLSTGSTYYVIAAAANNFKLATSRGGTQINITSDGTADLRTTGAGRFDWFEFWNIFVLARRVDELGEQITNYPNNYVLAHQVVKDLLGRMLPQYDGATAVIDTSATYEVDQLAYPDGVNAEQVLEDLMTLVPSHRWYVDHFGRFRWEPWPTTVRYEVTLDGGGSFPASTAEVFNECQVRWRNERGRIRSVLRTREAESLQGETRRYVLDLGDEIGSLAAAERAGDNFLAEHNKPSNKGTLTIDRPVRDIISHQVVDPFELAARGVGELIRVRGVESYRNAVNASSNDGRTVFRIFAADYTASSNSVQLELDADPRTVTKALKKLLKQRRRRR